MAAPSLYFQFTLVALIGLLSALSGRAARHHRLCAYLRIHRRGAWACCAAHGGQCSAFLGLVHKVYACGMLAGLVISTTKVGEFLSAMARLRISKKLTIPIAVMPGTSRRSARTGILSRTPCGWMCRRHSVASESPGHDGELHHVPLLTAASKAADELSIVSVTRGIENSEAAHLPCGNSDACGGLSVGRAVSGVPCHGAYM